MALSKAAFFELLGLYCEFQRGCGRPVSAKDQVRCTSLTSMAIPTAMQVPDKNSIRDDRCAYDGRHPGLLFARRPGSGTRLEIEDFALRPYTQSVRYVLPGAACLPAAAELL